MGKESNRRQIILFLSGLVLYLALSYTGSVRRTYRGKKRRPLPPCLVVGLAPPEGPRSIHHIMLFPPAKFQL